jgi:hypothetical protein
MQQCKQGPAKQQQMQQCKQAQVKQQQMQQCKQGPVKQQQMQQQLMSMSQTHHGSSSSSSW